jgi:predicted ATPase
LDDFEHVIFLNDRSVDLLRRVVLHTDGTRGTLTTREVELLGYLANRPRADVSRDELLREVWDFRARNATRAVDVAMRRLRAKVEQNPRRPVHLISVHGVGYRYVPADNIHIPRPPKGKAGAPIVGRGRELKAIESAFTDTRLVVLTGPGGIGKSRLAIRYAELHGAPGGSWFCDLSEVDHLAGLLRSLAQTLDVPLTTGEDDTALIGRLGHALAERGEALLVLDRVEAVLSEAHTLARWIDASPQLRVLATSRERLRLTGEHVLAVGPLLDAEGVELFSARARAAGAELAGADAESLTRLVRRLNGIPLAIELAAAQCADAPFVEVFDRLHKDTTVAAMEGVMESSWARLDPDEAVALTHVSVFVGGFTLDAAEAVVALPGQDAPWTLDLLESLHDHSLLTFAEPAHPGLPPRFSMLETIRAFARRRLSAAPDRKEAHERHASWALDYAERLGTALETEKAPQALAGLSQEVDNLLAVFRRGSAPTKVRTTMALIPLLHTQGPGTLFLTLLDAALETEAATPHQRVRLLVEKGLVHKVRGEMSKAENDMQQALSLSAGAGRAAQCEATYGLSSLRANQSRVDEAEQLALTALQLARELGDLHKEGLCRSHLGSLALTRGHIEQAVEHHRAAAELSHRTGSPTHRAVDAANLGVALMQMPSRLEEAELHMVRALAANRKMGFHRRTATTLMSLAALRASAGALDEAADLTQEALTLNKRVGHARFTGLAELNLGSIALARNRLDDALGHLERSIAHQSGIGDPMGLAMGHAYMAAALAMGDRLEEARSHHTRGASAASQIDVEQAQQLVVVAQGFLDLASGDASRARAVSTHGTESVYPGVQFMARILEQAIVRRCTLAADLQ